MIAPREAAREHLLMNLRLAEGLDLDAYRARWGTAPDAAQIAALCAEPDSSRSDGARSRATAEGPAGAQRVIAELAVLDRSTSRYAGTSSAPG